MTTKLYIPPPRPEFVPRPRLIERLNKGLYRKLILVSVPAGFGKTTLVANWGAQLANLATIPSEIELAWLSLDEADNDPTRNIYGKLNVHNRTQAMARSQELGLLPRK